MSPTAPTADTCTVQWYGATDGTPLALRRWRPAGEARAHVVALHGIVSHAGWYDSSCAYLAEQGYDVHFLDRRGSGMNGAWRGDVDHWHTWVDDLIVYLETLRGSAPVVLAGISWGGKIAPVVARRRPDLLSGIALVCPGIYAKQQPGLGKRFGLRVSKGLGIHEKQVTIPLQDPALFTESLRWQHYIKYDPLTLRTISMRFAREDLAMTLWSRASASFVYTPTIMMLSGRDRMVKNDKTIKYFRQLGSPDKTLLEYPSAAHTFEFEPNPLPIYADLVAWLDRKTERSD